MATIYHHLATFPSLSPFLATAHAPGWLRRAAHGMRDITREPIRQVKSSRTSQRYDFGSVRVCHSPTARLETVIPRRQMPQAAKILPCHPRKGGASTAEGREWLKHDNVNGGMFCERCCCFDRNEHRNQIEGMCINEA